MSDDVRDRRDVSHKSVLSGFQSKICRGVYVPGNEILSGNVDAKCNVSCSNVYEEIDPAIGLQGFQARRIAFNFGLSGIAFKQMVKFVVSRMVRFLYL